METPKRIIFIESLYQLEKLINQGFKFSDKLMDCYNNAENNTELIKEILVENAKNIVKMIDNNLKTIKESGKTKLFSIGDLRATIAVQVRDVIELEPKRNKIVNIYYGLINLFYIKVLLNSRRKNRCIKF